jgi:hypothetical protein
VNEHEARARLEAYLKPAAKPSGASRFPGGERKVPLRRAEAAAFPGRQSTPSNISTVVRDDSPAEIDKEVTRAERGSMPRLLLIGVFAICALGVISWLLFSLQGGANVKVGDCGIASSGTATGNTVNCRSAPEPPAAKP